jgi:hypothetical protein
MKFLSVFAFHRITIFSRLQHNRFFPNRWFPPNTRLWLGRHHTPRLRVGPIYKWRNSMMIHETGPDLPTESTLRWETRTCLTQGNCWLCRTACLSTFKSEWRTYSLGPTRLNHPGKFSKPSMEAQGSLYRPTTCISNSCRRSKTGDFDGLFRMAAAVHDAVSIFYVFLSFRFLPSF